MKGFIFTHFLEMVEAEHGYDMVDQLLTESELPSGGIYSAVGTYHYREMQILVERLSAKVHQPTGELYYQFGRYFFRVFEQHYDVFLRKQTNTLDLLAVLDDYIHVEVRKLYPEAELPQFKSRRLAPDQLELIYISERRMSAFAKGLIERCLRYYEEKGDISMEHLDESGTTVRFIISVGT